MEKEYDNNCLITRVSQHYFNDSFSEIYEVRLLKKFMNRHFFISELKEYYEASPLLIEAIENSEFKDVLYDYVYGRLVEYPVMLIASRKHKKAIFSFKDNLKDLEEKILKPYINEKTVNTLRLSYKQKMLRN